MTSAGADRSGRRDDYGSCNSQLCTSYLVGLLACVLVVGGVFLAFHRWDYMWLAVSAVGVLLILVGSVLHFCGDRNNRRRSKCKRTTRLDLGHGEQLLPSAPALSNAYSVSQLSLNMLPPYFPSYDAVSIATQPDGSISASQIMQINGQSFLLLPITEAMAETQSLANRRLSIQLMQSSLEQSSNKRLPEPSILQPSNFPTQPVNVPVDRSYSYPLQVGLPPLKNNSADTISTEETERTTEVDSNQVSHPNSENELAPETPTYLSLEPTYESLEPIEPDEPDFIMAESNWEEDNSIEVFYEPVPNLEEETRNETNEDSGPDVPERDTSVEAVPVNCQLPIPIPVVEEQEPTIPESEQSAMENNRTSNELNIPNLTLTLSELIIANTSLTLEELNIPNTSLTVDELNISNPSPRTITPEPEGRSTPPPSYEEVAHVAIGAYGVAYGTI